MTLNAKDFTLGISPLQQAQNNTGGFFATAQAIDPYRFPGMICPGPKPVAYTGASISDIPRSIAYTDSLDQGFLTTAGKLYNFDSSGNFLSGSGFVVYPYSTTKSNTYPHSIIKIVGLGDSHIIYFTDTDVTLIYNQSIGSVSETWGSGLSGGAALQNGFIHRAVFYPLGPSVTRLYFTNGAYIGILDITASPFGATMTPQYFSLPMQYYAKDIRVVKGNIEIYCDNGNQVNQGGKAAIVVYDGVTTMLDFIPIDDDLVLGSEEINGFPLVLSKGKGVANSIRRKDYWGYPIVQYLASSDMTIQDITPGLVSSGNSQLLVANNTGNQIYTYGTPFASYSYRGTDNTGSFPEALNCPYVTSGAKVYCFVPIYGKLIAASYTSGTTTGYLEYFPFGNYTSYNNANAQFQTNFIPLPKKCTVDWVRFVTQPVSANTAFTPKIYTDFSTTPITLSDGDLTSSNLDSNTNAKTYTTIAQPASNIAIGGAWSNSSVDSATIVISQIDVGLSVK